MKIEISDATLEQILTTVVKQEVEFLTQELVKDPGVRKALWCWLLQNFRMRAVRGAGIEDSGLDTTLRKYFEETGVPVPLGSRPSGLGGSGGAGGGDSGDREGEGSGGGGGGDDGSGREENPSGGGGGNGSNPRTGERVKAGSCNPKEDKTAPPDQKPNDDDEVVDGVTV
ncbi:MAG: hypothetical protein JNK87_20495 [Bryobacterales bacterium]|nr:hypothetical protein [Bryobacterales bacterium]